MHELFILDTNKAILVIRFNQRHATESSHILVDMSEIVDEETLAAVFDELSNYWWFNGKMRKNIITSLEQYRSGEEIDLYRTCDELVPQHTIVKFLP